MKREILFKAKRLDNGEWIDGYYVFLRGNKHFIFYGAVSKIEIDPNTLCQFTGLLDKNGKKIFEGDLVKMKKGRICKVDYRMTGVFVGFDFMPHSNVTPDNKPIEFDIYSSENLEIIGNIHDI